MKIRFLTSRLVGHHNYSEGDVTEEIPHDVCKRLLHQKEAEEVPAEPEQPEGNLDGLGTDETTKDETKDDEQKEEETVDAQKETASKSQADKETAAKPKPTDKKPQPPKV